MVPNDAISVSRQKEVTLVSKIGSIHYHAQDLPTKEFAIKIGRGYAQKTLFYYGGGGDSKISCSLS